MKTYVGISRDHSGSMRGYKTAAMNDFNACVESIKSSTTANNIDAIVSVVECGYGGENFYVPQNGTNRMVVVNSSITALQPITTYSANGQSTPLYDSIKMLIDTMKATPDYGSTDVSFLVMVVTDGEENSSSISSSELKKIILDCQKTDRWTFVMRVPSGTNKSHIEKSLGIPIDNILTWELSEKGMKQSTVATTRSIDKFYSTMASGTLSSGKFYADLSQVTEEEVKQTLTDISDTVSIFVVSDNYNGSQIRDFVTEKLGYYSKGCAFYQLTKTETIQGRKTIAIRDKNSNMIYSGSHARDILGIPQNTNSRVTPANLGKYDVFVQSTSVNRKLVSGTQVLVMK